MGEGHLPSTEWRALPVPRLSKNYSGFNPVQTVFICQKSSQCNGFNENSFTPISDDCQKDFPENIAGGNSDTN